MPRNNNSTQKAKLLEQPDRAQSWEIEKNRSTVWPNQIQLKTFIQHLRTRFPFYIQKLAVMSLPGIPKCHRRRSTLALTLDMPSCTRQIIILERSRLIGPSSVAYITGKLSLMLELSMNLKSGWLLSRPSMSTQVFQTTSLDLPTMVLDSWGTRIIH